MNIYFGNPLQSLTNQTLTIPSLIALSKSLISPLMSAVISLTGLMFDLTITSIKNLLFLTHLNPTIIALNPTAIFQSLSLLPHTGLLGTWLTDSPSFIAELAIVSEYASVEKSNQYCDFLRIVLDKHAPPSLRKGINHNSSP